MCRPSVLLHVTGVTRPSGHLDGTSRHLTPRLHADTVGEGTSMLIEAMRVKTRSSSRNSNSQLKIEISLKCHAWTGAGPKKDPRPVQSGRGLARSWTGSNSKDSNHLT